jgi:hypothetical protein
MLPEVLLYLVKVLLLPAFAGLAVSGLGVLMVARRAASDRARTLRAAQVAQALAAPVAFVASFLLETGPVGLPPAERWHVLPYAVGAAAIVGAIVSGVRMAWWVQWSIVVAVLGSLAWKFVVFPASNPYIQAGLFGAIVLVGLLWSAVARDACSVGMAMMSAIVFAGLGVLMVLANFASLGVMSIAAAAALAGLGMVSGALNLREAAQLRKASAAPDAQHRVDDAAAGAACPGDAACELVPWTAAAASSLAAIACVLALCGHAYNYGEVRPVHWAAILLSPFFALLVCKPCLRGAKPIVGVAWRAGLCLVVVLATIINAASVGDRGDDAGAVGADSDPMMDMMGDSQ